MKLPQLFRPKKLMAATARRASAASAGMDFDDIPEPNMKLSRALLIVLLLHVVAVSGIIAFNAIKTHESSFVPAATNAEANATGTPEPAIHADVPKARPVVSQKDIAPRIDPKASHSASKESHANTAASSGKSYIVKKGDNPVTIARRLDVSYDHLIALNHIDDPRKLRIGQKLLIPSKNAKAKPKKNSQ
jgi:LysM repeat protein